MKTGWMRCVLYLTLAAGVLPGAAFAQKNELGLTLGGIASRDQKATTGATVSFDTGTALQANYARKLFDGELISFSAGVHFLGNGSRNVASSNASVPSSVATLFVTPDVVVKILPHARVQPWGTVGVGYGQFEAGGQTLAGAPNSGKVRINRGVFVYGGGVDVPVWRFVALRGEVRDFVSGSASLNVPLAGAQHTVVAGGGFVLHW